MTYARDLGDAAVKANYLDNVSSDIQTQVTANILPAGLILPFGGTSAPTGFLACQGQVLHRSYYAALFASIGTTWNTGNESPTEFRLPDLRGAFLRGTGSHGTENMANGNDYAGPSVGSFENDQFQNHAHESLVTINTGTGYPDNTSLAQGNGTNTGATGGNTGVKSPNANSQGTPRVGDETRPFNAGILYCIKT
jgi:microcystin-dependent protein